jgi:hypothetical protein
MIDMVQLESQKRVLLSQVDGWSLDRLTYRPAPNAWSAIQVFDHLVKTEEGILRLAKQGVRSPHRIGIRDHLGFVFMRKVFLSDRSLTKVIA